MKRARVPGGDMAYVDEGTGDPVILVHGTPSSSREWSHIGARLSAHHRVLAPDHLGFGASDRPSDWRTYSLQWHTANFAAWLDQVAVPAFHLVVHDFGGPIALPIALAAPSRLLSLTVIQSWLWDLKAPNMDTVVMRWLYLSANFSARVMVRLAWGRRRKLTRELHAEFTRQFPTRASRAGAWGFARSVSHEGPLMDAAGRKLHRLAHVPTLLVWGKADRMVTASHFARWRQEFPHAEILDLEDVGHFPQIEAPDEVAAAIERRIAASTPMDVLRSRTT
jgi:haloalkane dehalogenase